MFKKSIPLILCLAAFFMASGQHIITSPYESATGTVSDYDEYGREIISVEGYVRMCIVDYVGESPNYYIDEWPSEEALEGEGKEIEFIMFNDGIPLTDYSTGEKNTFMANSFLLRGDLERDNPKEFARRYVNRWVWVRGPWVTDPVIPAEVMIEVIEISPVE